MVIAVDRKLNIVDRVAELQARATIKNNPILAVVELITNSDDSYRRLEKNGTKVDGRIIVELIRKHQASTIRVVDFAEGFDSATMDDRVGSYGGDTSGFTDEFGGRGFWGRGLKESMIVMGYGCVESINDNYFYKCTLEHLSYKRHNPVNVTRQIRESIGIGHNGTCVTLKILNEEIRIPQYETLKESLEFFYSLRDITTNPERQILLIEKNAANKIKRQETLRYIYPKGCIYEHTKLKIPGYPSAVVDLEMNEATESLSGHEEGPLRENGMLIRSQGAILDITLTRKFEDNKYSSGLFGSATCDYIDFLLRTEKEPIIHSDRSGLDWKHPFCRALESVLAKEIAVYVQDQEKKSKEKELRLENEKTRRRYLASLPQLNKIAKMELSKTEGEGEGQDMGRPIVLPSSGFDFVPDYVQIVVDKESTLTLKAIVPNAVPLATSISISSDTAEIIPLNKEIIFHRDDVDSATGLCIGHVRVIGKQVGAEGIITAEVGVKKAEIIVKVISRKKPSEKPEISKKSGLFRDFKFSPDADSRQRVRFERSSGYVIIATRAPSVEMYFGPNGEGQEEGHCQVLLAELVVEAVCREIARQKIEWGQEPYLGEASEAMNVIHNKLVYKYSHQIHAMLVEQKYHK
ncbi:MAG: hypothetical protein NTV42_09660 [Chloroflexi bacterium]|nr:hypothetical protein [Chloroflexota bacterium]